MERWSFTVINRKKKVSCQNSIYALFSAKFYAFLIPRKYAQEILKLGRHRKVRSQSKWHLFSCMSIQTMLNCLKLQDVNQYLNVWQFHYPMKFPLSFRQFSSAIKIRETMKYRGKFKFWSQKNWVLFLHKSLTSVTLHKS